MFRKLLVLPLLFLAFILFLSSCSILSTPGHLTCSDNPYLEKYHCSLDEVQQAAEQREPDAEYTLGYMYYYGIGTVRDRGTAILWIQKAARQGHVQAAKALHLLGQARTQGGKVNIFKGRPHLTTKSSRSPRIQPKQKNMPVHPQTCSRGSGYTIQMIGSHKLSDVHRFTKANHLQGKVSVHRETLDGLPWYIIAYGNYPSVRLAHKAIKTLPQSLRSLRPWVKACKDFKK